MQFPSDNNEYFYTHCKDCWLKPLSLAFFKLKLKLSLGLSFNLSFNLSLLLLLPTTTITTVYMQ